MLKKIVLPLFAVVFAVAAVFASLLLPQQGWFRNAMGVGVQANITTPGDTPLCSINNVDHLCKIGSEQAYDTQAHAVTRGNTGQLKYND